MRVLVTGGAGFIGSDFVRYLAVAEPEVQVTVLDLMTYAGSREAIVGCPRVELIVGDIRDLDTVDPLVAAADAVVNFAAESHVDNSLGTPEPFLTTNIMGTYTLLEACRRHGVRFHQISTDEVYGDLMLGEPRRFQPDSPYKPSSPYSATKAAADHLVRAWVRSYGVAATISNCSNNYGPFQNPEKFIPRTITGLIDGHRPRVYGDGAQVRDWINVRDHVRGVWQVLLHGRIGQTYLFGADQELANIDVARMLNREFGREVEDIEFVTDRPGHDQRYAIDYSQTSTELGWHPRHREFLVDLRGLIAWYRNNQPWWRPRL